MVAFFTANQDASKTISKRSQLLKQSLSKTLTLYYPLAGRPIDDISYDCNDKGVPYTVARFNGNLCDYLKKPDLSTLIKFVPEEIFSMNEMTPGGYAATFQETVFACGGFAVGMVFPHNLFEGPSMIVFMRTWATMMREGEVAQPPDFSSSYIFPLNKAFPQELTGKALTAQVFHREGKFVVRRFVFEGSALSNLKAKATRLGVHNPTRAEMVFAFLFKRIMSATNAKSTLISTAVNLRRKAVPEFPETSVGNILLPSVTVANSEETDVRSFVSRMREGISPINDALWKSLQGDQGLQSLCEFLKRFGESFSKGFSNGDELIVFNSWCNLGTNTIDFGSGKPIWIPPLGFAIPPQIYVIHLGDTRISNGIEAWVSLDEEIMSIVENDKELRSIASIDPSPLQIDSINSNL
ncbi:stemmadenine O-acetyltransferase-like [Tripterygium wilfordii]|uniref:stemmadenine O-acetyltransferase-like n=1 Tax=Tripterygium wilfordii TaxID=458696 RepID=UPI0018F853B4|nr:stemmadenine O-acetyltransferase-like [Tripterygium wilfordii]